MMNGANCKPLLMSVLNHRETCMRIIRPVLLCTLLVGIALTLALGPSVVSPGQAAAQQTGYGDIGASGIGSDTIPPRSLTIGALLAGLNLLLVAIIIAALLAAGAYVWWRRREGNIH